MNHHKKIELLDEIVYAYAPNDPNETDIEKAISSLDAALAAARADGIEAARRAVATEHGNCTVEEYRTVYKWALAAIDARTADAPESNTEGGDDGKNI